MAIWRFKLDNPFFIAHPKLFPWELFGVDKRDPPIGSLEDIGNNFVRSITRNPRTGEIIVEEYEANIDLL